MLRASISATSALAGRGAATTRRALPSAAASAFASLRALIVPSSSLCCSNPPASSWGSSVNRQSYGATAAAASDAPSAAIADDPTACDPSTYQNLSLLILLHECAVRAYGRPLLECADLLTLPTRLHSLPCCILLLASAPPPLITPLAATRAASAIPRTHNDVSAVSSGAPTRPENNTARPDSGGGVGGVGLSSECSGDGERGDGGALRVRYMNRAAAEALKAVTGSQHTGGPMGGGGGAHQQLDGQAQPRSVAWDVLALEKGSKAGELLQQLMAARGKPRRGQVAELTLLTADSQSGGASSGGGGASITCPEALVMPVMSPNGSCASVALLFDRWEVRDGGGRVLLEGRPLVPEIPPGSAPSELELAALQEGVRAQADAVRALKTSQGLANQDPRVVAAVAELQRLKVDLELGQRLRSAFSDESGPLQRLQQVGAE